MKYLFVYNLITFDPSGKLIMCIYIHKSITIITIIYILLIFIFKFMSVQELLEVMLSCVVVSCHFEFPNINLQIVVSYE